MQAMRKELPPARENSSKPKPSAWDTESVTPDDSIVKGAAGVLEDLREKRELTPSEYAELVGYSIRHVRRLIDTGTLEAREISGGRGGAAGKKYLIPVDALPAKYRKKYERLHGQQEPKAPARVIPLEEMSDVERDEAALWMQILKEWDDYRYGYDGPKAEADLQFEVLLQARYPQLKADRQKLYRQKRLLKAHGPGGLVDMRGKHDHHRKAIPDEVWNVFEYYYLDESRKTVAECMRLTEIYFKKHDLEIPPLASSATFSRAILDRIPAPVLQYERFGKKSYQDKCGMYIKRYYDDLQSNDIWVCDNHTFDIFVDDGESVKPVRVYLTGFLDVRSRKMVGWCVAMTPNSQATLHALRRGIERYGIPKRILADNGREFLTHDIGGRGHRKSADWGHEAPTILENMQIEFRTAQVRNARAKIIERAFREVKECFSRLFEGYTGGTTAERPERLKKTGKYAENFTPIGDFVKYVDKYIEGIFNYSRSDGIGMNGRTRNEVYAANLIEKRVATAEQLNLMMLRNSKPVKVQREGVALPMYDTKVYFNSAELLFRHIGKRVYFRYDPDDLREVRVYDEQDRFLCTAKQHGRLSYYASREEVKECMKELREYDRMVRNWKKQKGIEADKALDLVMWQAERNLAEGEELFPQIITPIRLEEPAELARAAGAGNDQTVDYSAFIAKMREKQNAERI